ncbi:cyclin [Candidatus Babeliales bacterium]|nr:cyclin [Candidatus Babeliales bacterium]
MLVRAGSLPKSVVLHALAYLKTIKVNYPDLVISQINIHRLFLVSTIIAVKAILDVAFCNEDWAKLTKVFTTTQVNVMEIEILRLLDYRLHIKNDFFQQVVAEFMG